MLDFGLGLLVTALMKETLVSNHYNISYDADTYTIPIKKFVRQIQGSKNLWGIQIPFEITLDMIAFPASLFQERVASCGYA